MLFSKFSDNPLKWDEIDKVEFFINNTSVFTDSIGPDYSFLWETDTLPDDENYVLAVIAYDLVGNEGDEQRIFALRATSVR